MRLEADVRRVASLREPEVRGSGVDGRAFRAGGLLECPCEHGLPLQHKSNTSPGAREDQHENNTDKTAFPGTRRHAC
jgi:hypothetical protein